MRASTVLRMVAIVALARNVASAHHPFSVNYDETRFGTLTGKVAKVQFTNPHVVVALDVDNGGGTTERWMIEGYPPNVLLRTGWAKDSLRVGDRITISGWHARDASLKIFSGSEVNFQDGSTRVFGSGPPARPSGLRWTCADGTTDCATAKWIPSIAD